MLWNLLQNILNTTQIQQLQKMIETLQSQGTESSPLVVAMDLEWLTWEQSESLLNALDPIEKKEEIFRQEKFLGQMGVASGFVTEEEVEEALQQVNPETHLLLWKVLENKNIVQSADFMAVCKTRKALCKQTLKDVSTLVSPPHSIENDADIPTLSPIATPPTVQKSTLPAFQKEAPEAEEIEKTDDLSDLDQFEDLDATLSEMALTVITEEEEEIVEVEVEDAYFEGGKYKRFKEWRKANYGEKLLKKLEVP